MTAAGIDADTVIPTLSPRYAFAAPNTMASRSPITVEVTVNSGGFSFAGTYGLKFFFSSVLLLILLPLSYFSDKLPYGTCLSKIIIP